MDGWGRSGGTTRTVRARGAGEEATLCGLVGRGRGVGDFWTREIRPVVRMVVRVGGCVWLGYNGKEDGDAESTSAMPEVWSTGDRMEYASSVKVQMDQSSWEYRS